MKNTSSAHAYSSCLFWNATNCIRRNGIYYNGMRMKYYNSDFFRKVGTATSLSRQVQEERTSLRFSCYHPLEVLFPASVLLRARDYGALRVKQQLSAIDL